MVGPGSSSQIQPDPPPRKQVSAISSRASRAKWPTGFDSCGEAKMKLFDYIEVFYNQRRRHSTLGQISPAAFRATRDHSRSANEP
jgi:hypothetical protein